MANIINLQSPSSRRFCGAAAATVAAGSIFQEGFAQTTRAMPESTQQTDGDKAGIRPFRVNAPQSELIELRRRIKATRWV